MRRILIALMLGYPINGFSQCIKISDLIHLGDSVLATTIGSTYHDYYKLDSISYYKYHKCTKKEKKHPLNGFKTKGKFVEASLRYKIVYPDIKELSSTLYIVIDNSLKVNKYTTDIPDFMMSNKSCTFIKKEKIISIGDSLLKEKGLNIEYRLYKEYSKDYFIWEVRNIIIEPTEDRFIDGLMETIKINPITGEIIEQKVSDYGYVF